MHIIILNHACVKQNKCNKKIEEKTNQYIYNYLNVGQLARQLNGGNWHF